MHSAVAFGGDVVLSCLRELTWSCGILICDSVFPSSSPHSPPLSLALSGFVQKQRGVNWIERFYYCFLWCSVVWVPELARTKSRFLLFALISLWSSFVVFSLWLRLSLFVCYVQSQQVYALLPSPSSHENYAIFHALIWFIMPLRCCAVMQITLDVCLCERTSKRQLRCPWAGAFKNSDNLIKNGEIL